MRLPIVIALCLLGGLAFAQDRKPYEITQTRIDAVTPEAELTKLTQRLNKAVAEGRAEAIDPELSPDFVTYDCFLDATQPCRRRDQGARKKPYAARKPARRIREDLCCSDIAPGKVTPKMRDETMLGFIGAALEPESFGRSALDVGLVCAPAGPLFDPDAARRLADAALIERHELRVAQQELVLREAPRKDAPEIARLPERALAPMVSEASQSLPDGWSAVATPDGRLGFTDQLALGDLSSPALCFAKSLAGDWKIAAAVERKP